MSASWLTLIALIGLIVLLGVVNGICQWRKYIKVVDERLSSYASLVKSCPIEQVPLVFQEVVSLIDEVSLTKRQQNDLQCLLSYLMGRNDQAGLPFMDQIVIV